MKGKLLIKFPKVIHLFDFINKNANYEYSFRFIKNKCVVPFRECALTFNGYTIHE